MDDPKKQLLERIKESTNVLVTVPANPTVDQLAGAIGFTLMLNKLGKHATAVFSGKVPDILEFLDPAKTLEKTTDSLRDFIIALDKSKADKLRYKVEDQHVKIFITPYKVSLSQGDLEFSQGDFNVDVVVALGVHEQKELDQAIVAHGRILHDATVSSINNKQNGSLGTINWIDPTASSLCEMLVSLCSDLKADSLDAQMATAMLTGIVAETKRFSNEKTTSKTMAISAQLMTAGANQQLVAAKLQEELHPAREDRKPQPFNKSETREGKSQNVDRPVKKDGSLQIEHAKPAREEPEPEEENKLSQIHIDSEGEMKLAKDDEAKNEPKLSSKFVMEPPALGGRLTANSEPEHLDPSTDPLGPNTNNQPLLSHDSPASSQSAPMMPLPEPQLPQTPVEEPEVNDDQTLDAIEKTVDSSHQVDLGTNENPSVPAGNLDAARDAVQSAMPEATPAPRFDLNAQQADLNLGPSAVEPVTEMPVEPQPLADTDMPSDPSSPPAFQAMNPPLPTPPPEPTSFQPPTLPPTSDSFGLPTVPNMPSPTGIPGNPGLSQNLVPLHPGLPTDNTSASTDSPTPPPPLPPPMTPPSFTPSPPDNNPPNQPL